MTRSLACLIAALCLTACAVLLRADNKSKYALTTNDEAHTLAVVIDEVPVLTYVHHPRWATPHYFPLRSPSGKDLVVQQTEPFPHHRAIWVADRIKVGQHPEVDFYHDFKNLKDAKNAAAGHRHFIEHVGVTRREIADNTVSFSVAHRWIVNESTPVMDETHDVVVTDLGNGEYIVDLSFKLTAMYGDALFTSDWVHYAWPYIRMHPQFSGEAGGTITDDRGRTGQKATDGQVARWIDYSNTIDGVTEGLAVFIHPDGVDHRWLTREYGTFGPRRADKFSGTRFTLKQGESLTGRVALLVHRGDVVAGQVAKRYEDYVGGGRKGIREQGIREQGNDNPQSLSPSVPHSLTPSLPSPFTHPASHRARSSPRRAPSTPGSFPWRRWRAAGRLHRRDWAPWRG